MARKIRFHWHYISETAMHSTELEFDGLLMNESVIKERIAITEGDRTKAQYLVLATMEWA